MSDDKHNALTDLAGAILDGTPVDWASADSVLPAQRSLVRHLKSIAAIAAAQRPDAPETWGPLRLLDHIGHGAFGDVYRAWDVRLDRQVALKLLPVDETPGRPAAAAVLDEGRLLARVSHPNVVTVYGAEQIGDYVGLWMELVEGRTLHQLVAEDGRRFSPVEVARIGQALCSAVAAVHAAGLFHRDIKAQNVMLTGDDRVVLMDFGAGREGRANPVGDVTGTPLYLAPEVLAQSASASVQTDIYSVGVLLYFLLTGSYPVTAADFTALRAAHARGARGSLDDGSNVPRWLRRAVEQAIDPDPARRHMTAGAMRAALEPPRTVPWLVVISGVAAAAVLLAALVSERLRTPVTPGVEVTQIAVLPLRAGSADDAHFADGLTGEIIRNLGTVRGLEVRSPSASSGLAEPPQEIGDLGRQLGVEYVLGGSVARGDGRLRVDAELVKVNGRVPVWSQRFERSLSVDDILTIQDDISRAVVNRLKLSLGQPQRRYTTNLEIYENYLRARTLAQRQGVSDPLRAVTLFEQVIAADPAYAPAHAGLVLAFAYLSMSPYQGVTFEKAHAIMRAAATEAVRLDPMLAEAQAARGWVHAREFEWAEAERAFRRALELNPGLMLSYTSLSFSTLQPLGRVADAEQLLRDAWRIDPYSTDVQFELARVLVQANRLTEAIAILEPLRRTDSNLGLVDLHMGRALALLGRYEESLPFLERHRQRLINPRAGPDPWVAWPYVKLGRRADVEKLARDNASLPFRRAIIHAALGDREGLFAGLEEMAHREPQRLLVLMRAPEFAPYQPDERFKGLLRRFNVPVD